MTEPLLNIAPPVARVEPTETSIHNRTLVDNYAWLRQKSDPEVIAYLEAENAYTEAVMKPTDALQKILYDEMVSHIKETDESVPFREGDYFYYSRTEQARQYPIYCRKHGSVESAEEIILDVNKLAEGQDFMAIGAFAVSDDGTLLAYSTDTTGFRQYTLQIKDLRSGELLSDRAERVGSVEWANDNRTLLFSIEDEEQKRQFQLYRHVLGSPHSEDALVYEESDERFNIGVGKTRDGRYLMLESASHTASEVRFLSADRPSDAWRLVAERQDNFEYYADHRNGLLYIRTNDAGRNFRVVTVPIELPGRENWEELIPHRAEVMLEDVDLFADFFVSSEQTACQHYASCVSPPPGQRPLHTRKSVSRSRSTVPIRTPIANSKPQSIAIATSLSSRQAPYTSTTSSPPILSCSSSRRCPAVSTETSIDRNAFSPRRPMASRSRSHSSTAKIRSARRRTRCTSTAMAPMDTRFPSGSTAIA
jgi:oligopeptidase B